MEWLAHLTLITTIVNLNLNVNLAILYLIIYVVDSVYFDGVLFLFYNIVYKKNRSIKIELEFYGSHVYNKKTYNILYSLDYKDGINTFNSLNKGVNPFI